MRFVSSTFGRCALALVCVLALAAPAAAQFDRGTISGTVKDSTGGVVPGVTVSAKSQQTQELFNAVTDATGYYTVTMLRPGRYDVSAELDGFKKSSRTGIPLDAGASIKVEFTLEPGNISESVTVVAMTTPIQTDVAVRKTVEAKDIELLSFSGRNPIGVPALKPGVVGGNFNNAGFAAFSNGGFNMNGSRADENTIYVDGAVAIRTRSAGTIIGNQNVDAVQEVQVLTANYMPEYGRASGGQIRFITKSGSSRYSGSASYFYRDDKLQANTWARNRSSVASDHTPAPFNYKQYGWSFGGPVPGEWLKNKLFFFAAQEWVNYYAVATASITVPTEAMRNGDFSQLLGSNPFYATPQTIKDPLTGLPFPGNIIPANRLSPNGIALMKLYPLPTPGYQSGSNNVIINSDNPVNTRKDNLRFDYRLGNNHSFTWRWSKYNYTAIDAFRANLPYARTDWNRPNTMTNVNWAWTISNNLINEASFAYSIDQVFINVFTESGLYKRSRTGVNYPYIYPGKEIEDKIPTVNLAKFQQIDGGPYPSSSEGPIWLWTDAITWVKGRHTMKAGVAIEYSGEDDFDQINVQSIPGGTNNQNGQFDFNDGGATGVGVANMALGLFTNYAEIGQRARTNWRSLATDIFVQDSWRPNEKVTVEGGFRYAIWPPWYSTTNNIANFDPRFYDRNNQAVINPSTGRLVSGPRYNGIVLPGDGFIGAGNDLTVAKDPAVQALFRGEPRGFSQTHYDLIEPRAGVSYAYNDKTVIRGSAGIFHNRVTLNDSTILGGNPPFQPMVTVSNGSADNPGGVAFANDLPYAMQGQDVVFKLPMSYMYSVGVQRQLPWKIVLDVNYVGRQGRYLQRERNVNQLPEGTLYLPANAGINIAALRPYKGYGALRVSENSGRSQYNSIQIGAERRYANGFKLGVAYTYGRSYDNGSDKRNVLWNSYNDANFWGPSSYDRRHALVVSYIYDLPFFKDQSTVLGNILGGWQISGATFIQTGTPFSITRSDDKAGVGEGGNGQPVDLVGDIYANTNSKFSMGSGLDNNFWFNPAAFAQAPQGRFGNSTRDIVRNPGAQQWDIALFKNFVVYKTHRIQFRAEVFNFINHPNLSGPNTDITNPNFGRVITKDGARRDIQLALRYYF